MPRFISAALATWLALCMPSLAVTPMELVDSVQGNLGKISFEGHRVQLLVRQSLALRATMQINYRDDKNYRVVVQDPGKLTNVNIWLDSNKASVYFPDENLIFRNDNPSGATEFAATILGQITTNPDLLYRSYDLRVLSIEDMAKTAVNSKIADRDCHVLDVTPKNGYTVPGHRYWIAKDNFQIMREDRSWGADIEPYFKSYFDEFVPTSRLDLKVVVPRDVNTIELKTSSKDNSFATFRTVAEAEKALGSKLALPAFVPTGFQLSGIQFPIFYGSRMTLVSYTDGVNWLYIQYRPKPTMWVTLLAGAYAIKLVEKFQELSFQAPYNYYGAEKGEAVLFAYGDLYPDQLQRVGDSLQLKTASR